MVTFVMAMKHFEIWKLIVKQWKHLRELALCGSNLCRGTTNDWFIVVNPPSCKPTPVQAESKLTQNLLDNSTSKRNTRSTILHLGTTYWNAWLLLTNPDDASSACNRKTCTMDHTIMQTFLRFHAEFWTWWNRINHTCVIRYFTTYLLSVHHGQRR